MYGNMVEENVMCQQLQKICRGKVCTKKFFGNIWENPGKIFFAPPKNCLLLHLCITSCLLTCFFQTGNLLKVDIAIHNFEMGRRLFEIKSFINVYDLRNMKQIKDVFAKSPAQL